MPDTLYPFVVVEGVDGVGKTSIAQRLARRLGFNYFKTPSKTFEEVRSFFDHRERPPLARFSLYLASLIEDTRQMRIMLRKAGVVCDRYTMSLQFYHEELSGSSLCGVVEGLDWLCPAATVILHATKETIASRIGARISTTDSWLETNAQLMDNINRRYLLCDALHVNTDDLKPGEAASICFERLLEMRPDLFATMEEVSNRQGALDGLRGLLASTYGLRHLRVADYHDDYQVLTQRLGHSGAALLEQEIAATRGRRVGVGGGSTLFAVIDSLASRPRPIDIYNMSFMGRGPEIDYVGSDFLANLLLQKSRPDARGFVASLPPLPSKRELAIGFVARTLAEIPEIGQVLRRASDVDVAFVGAGAMIPTGDMKSELTKLGVKLHDLSAAGAIGGINYNWIDSEGKQVDSHWLAVSIDDLRRMVTEGRSVVLVAGGEHKVPIVRTALQARIANCLVTDSKTVSRLAAELR